MRGESHWESVYRSKQDEEVSWTQTDPTLSLSLIHEFGQTGRVIDIGGGTSPLAGRLLDLGYAVAVIDLSQTALERCQSKLGARAGQIEWIVADVTKNPELGECDIWHDRAVFHFLITPEDRRAYVELMNKTLVHGGCAMIATFDLNGPERCSGLEVQRYNGPALAAELGPGFRFLKSVPETHRTPWGQEQAFQYSVFRRL